MVVPFPGTTVSGLILPVRVGEPLCMFVMRIAYVGMLEWRLSERKQQAGYHANMK